VGESLDGSGFKIDRSARPADAGSMVHAVAPRNTSSLAPSHSVRPSWSSIARAEANRERPTSVDGSAEDAGAGPREANRPSGEPAPALRSLSVRMDGFQNGRPVIDPRCEAARSRRQRAPGQCRGWLALAQGSKRAATGEYGFGRVSRGGIGGAGWRGERPHRSRRRSARGRRGTARGDPQSPRAARRV
jgi:hypothetical protein